MIDKNSEFLKFIDYGLELAKSIPRYFSKYSNKIYCNHQHIILLVLKQKLKTTYRGLIEWLKATSEVRLLIGLNRIPHHTTLVKFVKKLKPRLLNLLLPYKKARIVAIDTTGFELEAKSYYYRNLRYSDVKQKTKRFMKLSIAVDTDKQLILTHRIRRDYKRCNKEFRAMLKELIKVEHVMADKQYDTKENRKYVINKLKAIPHIPLKRTTSRKRQVFATSLFNEKIYHQRSKVEAVFSVIKRKYGSCLKSKSFAMQKIELICKLIAYNIDRKIIFYLLLEGFSKASIQNI